MSFQIAVCRRDPVTALRPEDVVQGNMPGIFIIEDKTGTLEEEPADPIRKFQDKCDSGQEILIPVFSGHIQPSPELLFSQSQCICHFYHFGPVCNPQELEGFCELFGEALLVQHPGFDVVDIPDLFPVQEVIDIEPCPCNELRVIVHPAKDVLADPFLHVDTDKTQAAFVDMAVRPV